MGKEIKQGILFTLVTMVLLGGGYNLVLWAIGQAVFAAQAEGSLIRRPDGTIVGSRLIAQKFSRPDTSSRDLPASTTTRRRPAGPTTDRRTRTISRQCRSAWTP